MPLSDGNMIEINQKNEKVGVKVEKQKNEM